MNVESELNIPQEDWYETFIRYGLYFGAVFQLLCLCACVMLPGSKKVKYFEKNIITTWTETVLILGWQRWPKLQFPTDTTEYSETTSSRTKTRQEEATMNPESLNF